MNLSDHDRRLLDGLFDEVEAERAATKAAEDAEADLSDTEWLRFMISKHGHGGT